MEVQHFRLFHLKNKAYKITIDDPKAIKYNFS